MKFIREDHITAEAAESPMFTVGVWRSEILASLAEEGDGPGLRAHRFAYQPGARSAWHTHEGEQALYVVAGRGLVQRWGEQAATVIQPGDWVHVQPGEKHWHGAAPDDTLLHLAVTATGGTMWHEPVTDAQYRAAASSLHSLDPSESPCTDRPDRRGLA